MMVWDGWHWHSCVPPYDNRICLIRQTSLCKEIAEEIVKEVQDTFIVAEN